MEKEIRIISCEPKESKEGRIYHRFKTSEGWMSCFEKEICEKLKLKMGETVKLEIVETENGFKNIRKICEAESKTEARSQSNYSRKEMYVSYAKDIFIEIYRVNNKELAGSECMKLSIELVKLAKDAFE